MSNQTPQPLTDEQRKILAEAMKETSEQRVYRLLGLVEKETSSYRIPFADIQWMAETLERRTILLRDAVAILNAHAVGHSTQQAIREELKS